MNRSSATGKRRGSSGFVRPEMYAKVKAYKADVCEKNIGYSLMDYADNVENYVVSGDYRILYKHFYFADENNNLTFRTEGGDDEFMIDKEDFLGGE